MVQRKGNRTEIHICGSPQANGKTKVSNRTLVQGIKKRLGKAKGNWVDELLEVLWLYKTTPRTSTKGTPFCLAYRAEEMLPEKMMIGSIRTEYCPKKGNSKTLRENLDLLEERRECSSMRQAAYKNTVERYYNQCVKDKAF